MPAWLFPTNLSAYKSSEQALFFESFQNNPIQFFLSKHRTELSDQLLAVALRVRQRTALGNDITSLRPSP